MPLESLARTVLVCLATGWCADVCLADLTPGNYHFRLQSGARERSYIVHVPKDTLTNPWPVVLNLHGGGSSAAGQQAYSRMDEVADREGFLVVYPNGTGRLAEHLLTWNAGGCCGYAARNNVDDVAFIRAVIDDLAERAEIDRERIYATGLSNGAMMAYRLAAEASDLIAAIAPVAGARRSLPATARRPVPILHIHSVNDTRALYGGGLGPPYPLTSVRVQHPSVEQLLGQWAKYDGCPARPSVSPPVRGEGHSASHTATRLTYGPCNAGAEIVLLKLNGPGHVWPGASTDYLGEVLGSQSKAFGPTTNVIDANREIWRFFSWFHLRSEVLAHD
jgi:polyhydroxybutyrate depolymerase